MTEITSPNGQRITVLDDAAMQARLKLADKPFSVSMALSELRIDVMRTLWEHSPYTSESGQATAGLIRDCGMPENARHARAALSAPTVSALIEQRINGKRCYRIELKALPERWLERVTGRTLAEHLAAVEQPPELHIELGPPVVHTPPPVEIVEPEVVTVETVETVDPDIPAMVGTVRLVLDLDPRMARLVLDVVERGKGVRPIDRDQVQSMIGHAADRQTKANAEAMTRLLDRLGTVERDTAQITRAIRAAGVLAPANPQPAPETTTAAVQRVHVAKPDFRYLGVKNSELRRLIRELAADGWAIDRRPGGHLKATKDGFADLTMPSTPSDNRSVLNSRSQARRNGANV